MKLLNAQLEFIETLLTIDDTNKFVAPCEQFFIYRDNITSTFIQTLTDIYPLTFSLLGEDFFRQTAKAYIFQYPSRSSNLNDYGEYFSSFLADYSLLVNFPYLSEVAQFEWYCHKLYDAPDHTSKNLLTIKNLSANHYEKLQFILHPASQLMQCNYPILQIINLCKNNSQEIINIDSGGTYLFIFRPLHEISLLVLSEDEYVFLTALNNEKCLADALLATLACNPDFKLEEKLPKWIENKVIVDFIFPVNQG